MQRDTHFILSGVTVPGFKVPGLMRRSHCAPIATLLLLALLASGCSGTSLLGTPSATATDSSTLPPASGSPSFRDKISNFFAGSTATSQQGVTGAAQEIDCPLINIRQGASTLTIGATGSTASDSTNNGAMAVKYQGTFVRAARECALVNGNVVMKIGVQGRIIIGPSGGPGQVDVPLRIAVVEETTAHTKPIFTQLIRIPVTVASATENPTFTHIEEGVTFPMPANLDNYVVYIGFDPIAAAAQDHPKPAPKPKPKPKPAKTG
jgi:hypothetical protein